MNKDNIGSIVKRTEICFRTLESSLEETKDSTPMINCDLELFRKQIQKHHTFQMKH